MHIEPFNQPANQPTLPAFSGGQGEGSGTPWLLSDPMLWREAESKSYNSFCIFRNDIKINKHRGGNWNGFSFNSYLGCGDWFKVLRNEMGVKWRSSELIAENVSQIESKAFVWTFQHSILFLSRNICNNNFLSFSLIHRISNVKVKIMLDI